MTTSSSRAASAALTGYYYQRDVTVWVALRLLLLDQLTETVEVEPLTEEDLESGSIEHDRSVPKVGIQTDTYRVSLQIKSKSSGNWTPGAFKTLLSHGTDRPSAIEQLGDPTLRFMLVTDAAPQGNLANLTVRGFADWPQQTPKAINNHTKLDSHGRLGIMPGLTRELLDFRIEKCFTESLKVPSTRWKACYESFGDDILELMRHGGGAISRNDALAKISAHDGYAGAFGEADFYVRPKNFDAISQKLADDHAVLIVGPSGTGKTWLTKALIDALMFHKTQKLTREVVSAGPSQIIGYNENAPVVFDIEDPWGKYARSSQSGEWSATLPDLLAQASANRKYVVTSRSDFFEAAKPKHLEKWFVPLTAENYTRNMRGQMFQHRLALLPRAKQRLADPFRSKVLTALETPLEIDKFFLLLRNEPPPDQSDTVFVQDCMDRSRGDVIENSIVAQIDQSNAHAAAAIIWGLLKAFAPLTKLQVGSTLGTIANSDHGLADEIDALIDHLVAGFFLKLKDGALSYRHNLVEKGLRQSFSNKRFVAQAKLNQLVSILTSANPSEAAALASALVDDEALKLDVGTEILETLESRLLKSALDAEPKYVDQAFSRLGKISRKTFAAGRLVRWLMNKKPQDSSFFLSDTWEPLETSDEFYEAVGANLQTPTLIRKFLEDIVPYEHWARYPKFTDKLYRLDPTIGGTFRKACCESFDNRGVSSNDVLIDGVIHEVEQSKSVVATALTTLKEIRERWETEEHTWALINDEYPDQYAQHITEGYGEDLYPAEKFLTAYVEAVRDKTGWSALLPQLSDPDGAGVWIQVAARDKETSVEELLQLAKIAEATGQEDNFWQRLHARHEAAITQYAAERAVAALGEDTRLSALRYWAHCSDSDATALSIDLLDRRGLPVLVASLLELSETDNCDADGELVAAMLSALPEEDRTIAHFILREDDEGARLPELSEVMSLQRFENRRLVLATLNARVRLADDVQDDVIQIFRDNTEPDFSIGEWLEDLTVFAAAKGYEDALREALQSPYAIVVSVAVNRFSPSSKALPEPITPHLKTKSQPIAAALIARIEAIGAAACLPALIELTGNTVQKQTDYPYAAHYSFAHDAANLLLDCESPLGEAGLSQLYETGCKTNDRELKRKLWGLVLQHGPHEYEDKVLKLVLSDDVTAEIKIVASAALVAAKGHLELGSLSAKDAKSILARQPLQAAIHMAVVLGTILNESRLEEVMNWLAMKAKNRHGLLIPLAQGVLAKSDETELKPLHRLHHNIRDQVLEAAQGGAKLPRNGLEAIGHIRTLDALIEFYGENLFETKP